MLTENFAICMRAVQFLLSGPSGPGEKRTSARFSFTVKHGVRLNHVHNRGFGGDGLLDEFNRLPHHTPEPGGMASLDPQTVLQYLTLCVTTIMRP